MRRARSSSCSPHHVLLRGHLPLLARLPAIVLGLVARLPSMGGAGRRRRLLHCGSRVIAIAMAVQLVPLPAGVVDHLSPHAADLAGAQPRCPSRAAAERRPGVRRVGASVSAEGPSLVFVLSRQISRAAASGSRRAASPRSASCSRRSASRRTRPARADVLAMEAAPGRRAAVRAVRQPQSFRHVGGDRGPAVSRLSPGARLRPPSRRHPRERDGRHACCS